MFDIVKFCNNKRCEREIEYNQLATGGNDPTQSRALAYSHYVKYNRKKHITARQYNQILEILFYGTTTTSSGGGGGGGGGEGSGGEESGGEEGGEGGWIKWRRMVDKVEKDGG